MGRFIFSAAAALAVAVGVPASAETRSTLVEYSDLDLASPQGVQTLERRLRNAARQVCGAARIRPLKERMEYHNCIDEAGANAEEQVAAIVEASSVLAVRAEAEAAMQ